MAEFYFDFNMKTLKDDLGIKSKLPKLYIERDYQVESVTNIMYVVFPQWNATADGKTRPEFFDRVTVYYDICGIGIDKVLDVRNEKEASANDVEIVQSFGYDEYVKEGFRHVIMRDEDDYSGVGKIVFKNTSSGKESVLLFAVNFGFKKRIQWKISGDRIIFVGKNISRAFKFLLNDGSEYPCLKRNIDESNVNTPFEIDFSSKEVHMIPIDMRKHDKKKLYICFDPKDEDAKKYYLLECLENTTLDAEKKDFDRQSPKRFCPYCHGAINYSIDLERKYKSGGVACDGKRFTDTSGNAVKLMEGKARKRIVKNTFYCANDFRINNETNELRLPDEDADFMRILPEKYLKHNHFKIIVVGSKRSGKTTFISRLFDIGGKGRDTELHMKHIKNGTRKLFDLEPYSIKTLAYDYETTKVMASKDSWYKTNSSFYEKYSIDIEKGKFLDPTNNSANMTVYDKKQDLTKYPFVMEANKNDYIYFYDMAGEDAQQSGEFVGNLVESGPLAVFYLVDSEADPKDISNVARRISELLPNDKDKKDKKEKREPFPIAVIVTKFDAHEKEFDENCHCLRGDVQEMLSSGGYEGSELEQNVDLASEEIRSFLAQKGIRADFGENANVKYFGVSSFASPDSIFHKSQTAHSDEVNYLLHMSSPKRMELPIIWTLRQLGCII